MFIPFFEALRKNGVPVSMREFLAFLEGMKAGIATYDIDAFYYLARVSMVKATHCFNFGFFFLG